MNYKSDNGDNGNKSLEREFTERVRVIEYARLYDEFIALLANPERKKPVGDPGALIHLLEGAALPTLLKGDVYKFIQTVFGKTTPEVSAILHDEIKRFRADRFLDWVCACDKKLKESGREPTSIDIDDILIPLVKGISTKKNTLIQEIYANLLTGAIAGEKVDIKDVNNANLLETNDVLVLEAIYQAGRTRCQDYELIYRSGLTKTEFQIAIDGLLSQGIVELTSLEDINILIESALSNITRDRGASEFFADEKQLLELDLNTVSNSLQNALKLIIDAQTINKYDYIKFTTRGWEFMRKCKGILTKTVENDPK
jgi:hypothetical protein